MDKLTVFDIRVEIENVDDFKELEAVIRSWYEKKLKRKIHEISCLNVD